MSKGDAKRFWALTMPAPTGDCILWIGGLKKDGYGNFTLRWPDSSTRWVTASRWAYEQANGRIDPLLQVLHTCDFAACVNHRHLYQGAQKQNSADAVARGRTQSGFHKLPFNPEHLLFIQSMAEAKAPGTLTNKTLTAIQARLSADRKPREDLRREIADTLGIKIGMIHLIDRARFTTGAQS